MDNSAYVPNQLPPPLVVFSQATGGFTEAALRMSRPFAPHQLFSSLHIYRIVMSAPVSDSVSALVFSRSAKPKTCRIRSAKRLRRSIIVSITCCTCSTSFCIPSTIGCPSVAVPSDPSRRRPSHRHRSASSSRRRSSARPSPPNSSSSSSSSSNNSTNSNSRTSNRAGLRAPRAALRVHRRRRRDCRASARSATCRPCSRPSRRLKTSRPRARPTRRPADRRPAATSRIRTRPRARTIRPRRTSARPPVRRPAPRTPRDPRPRKDDPIAMHTHLAPRSRREPREWWKEEAAPPPPTPRYQPLGEEVESTTVDDRVNRPNLPSCAADNGVRGGSVLRSRARLRQSFWTLCWVATPWASDTASLLAGRAIIHLYIHTQTVSLIYRPP
uniref:Uncharacterized protein n=1 Tax=Trichogramma kaykai TaxID=54128 RepID=A0ABD2W3M9_9HYME